MGIIMAFLLTFTVCSRSINADDGCALGIDVLGRDVGFSEVGGLVGSDPLRTLNVCSAVFGGVGLDVVGRLACVGYEERKTQRLFRNSHVKFATTRLPCMSAMLSGFELCNEPYLDGKHCMGIS